MVQVLVDAGANVNDRGYKTCTPLQIASRYGREGAVKILLDAGADVSANGGVYGTAMQAALAHGHQTIVEMLIQRGAKSTVQFCQGE